MVFYASTPHGDLMVPLLEIQLAESSTAIEVGCQIIHPWKRILVRLYNEV
jgi:hypothetical protein